MLQDKLINQIILIAIAIQNYLTTNPFMFYFKNPNRYSTFLLILDFPQVYGFCSSVNGLLRYLFL